MEKFALCSGRVILSGDCVMREERGLEREKFRSRDTSEETFSAKQKKRSWG